jgi:hypothetical protein
MKSISDNSEVENMRKILKEHYYEGFYLGKLIP